MPGCRATDGSPTPRPIVLAENGVLATESALTELGAVLSDWLLRHDVIAPDSRHPIAIAYSGGLDSSVLLNVAHAIWPEGVVAMHVNHGLQEAARVFEAHCVAICKRLNVPLAVLRANVAVPPGASLEEEARNVRYDLLCREATARSCGGVLLAQHASDQAETVLLALSRGAGVAGLAGMAEATNRQGVLFGRPWLGVAQQRLKTLAQAKGWSHVDDPSNEDMVRTRNRIRHDVMPTLEAAFPHIVSSVARVARHCAESTDLLADLARVDIETIGQPPLIQRLQALSVPRQANVLRHWLRVQAGRAPSTAQLDELLKQVGAARTRGHRINIKVGTGRVVREGAALVYVAQLAAGGDEKRPSE